MRKIPTLELEPAPTDEFDTSKPPQGGDRESSRLSAIFKRHRFIESGLSGAEDLGLLPTHSNSAVDQRKVRTKFNRKPHRDFGNLRHVQRLELPLTAEENAPVSHSPIWSVSISPDGIYMAAAGTNKIIWVWTVLYNHEGEQKGGQAFANRPVRIFEGHTDEIQQLAWSRNNFLASASLDRTVKLWHVERSECLGTFTHPDVVSSVQFHPIDDRFFVTGCLDRAMRLWSIPDREMCYEYECPSPVSAITFGPKGGILFAGCFDGQIVILMTDGLKLRKRLQVGSQHKLHSAALRVTGIVVFVDEDEAVSRVKVLVSSNGSRLRIYDLQTLDLDCKYRGLANEYSLSSASLSPDKRWVISPSEDRKTYIWARNDTSTTLLTNSTKNAAHESFKSNKGTPTCAIFVPEETKKFLDYSNDLIVTSDTEGEIRIYHNGPDHVTHTGTHLFPRSLLRSFSMSKRSARSAKSEESDDVL